MIQRLFRVTAGSLALVFLCAATPASANDQGALVIAGGAISEGNHGVYRGFASRILGKDGRVAVIAAASGSPVESASALAATLESYGVARSRIDIVRLAVVDDESTPDEDESLWIGHASSETEISKISGAGAIWFTGGDQTRLTQVLLRPDGSDTPMLREIRKRLSDGAVVGGTSAGAAVMGSMMIARGDTLTSLSTPVVSDGDASRLESGALVMARGLGLLPSGLTDQHFDRQARLGRLARALTTVSAKDQVGFGVDEDTAFIVDFKSGRASVAGAGSVTIINAVNASQPNSGQGFAISGLRVHVLSEGDTYIMSSGEVLPAGYKTSTRGKEYHDHEASGGGGMAIPNQRLEDVLGIDLVDSSKAKQLTRVSFGDQGRGVCYRFEKTISTDGFQGRAPDGRLRYTIVNVMFAINPVIVDIRPVQ